MALRSGRALLPATALRATGATGHPEEAAAYPFSEAERQFSRERMRGQALGSPETVRKQLTDLLEQTRADELMLTTMVYDVDERIRSFELIAEHVADGLRRNG